MSIAIRSVIGGILMGLANLVPGISGGTMLVASGVYTRFIDAIAEVTGARFRPHSLVTLACVIGGALSAIILLAGMVKGLVVDHRWIMYSIFIGLTLGGVPVVWKMVGKATPGVFGGAVAGFIGMAAIAWMQFQGTGESASQDAGFLLMFIAGVAGASAMILPGVSGGYLLLVLGVYVPILAGIDTFKNAARAQDFSAMQDPLLQIVVPVGLGVVIGVVVVSHALRYLLHHYEKATLGVLIGLLFGAVVGLYPFQVGVAPQEGATFKGDTVTIVDGVLTMETTGKVIGLEDYPTELFTPTAPQVGGAIGLIIGGFAITALIARFSAEDKKDTA